MSNRVREVFGLRKPNKYGDCWRTPSKLYKSLDDEFNFDDFDPCPYPYDPARDPDGLAIEWAQHTFVNPPFSDLSSWIRKAWSQWKKGKTIVMLMPSRTDIAAFHECILPFAEMRFIQGRIPFIDRDGSQNNTRRAPFACMLAIWRAQK